MNLVSAELYFICRVLSPCTTADRIGDLRQHIKKDAVSWDDVIDRAHGQLLAPALWKALSEKRLTDVVPQEIGDYLRSIHALNVERNRALRRQAAEAISSLNRCGIVPLLYKGAAQLFETFQDDFGSRMMVDLDFLVPAERLNDSIAVLHELGYRDIYDEEMDYDEHHHWAPMFRAGNYGSIELHRDVLSPRAGRLSLTARFRGAAERIEKEDLAFFKPNPTDAALLTILNSQVVDEGHRLCRLDIRSLNDFTTLAMHRSPAIDWHFIVSFMENHGLVDEMSSYWLAAHRLFGLPLPRWVRCDARARSHYHVSLAAFQWELVEKAVRKYRAFSKEEICELYGCKDRFWPLAVNRLRYLGLSLKNVLTAD